MDVLYHVMITYVDVDVAACQTSLVFPVDTVTSCICSGRGFNRMSTDLPQREDRKLLLFV